jgi:hypothetical protein
LEGITIEQRNKTKNEEGKKWRKAERMTGVEKTKKNNGKEGGGERRK